LSLADFVFSLIVSFDRAKPKSPIFDEAAVPAFKTFISHFRGARVVKQDPLVVEIYSDQLYPDSETIAAVRAADLYTVVPWHELALGVLAERGRELAFSASKADRLKVEWMSFIGGPSLAVLDRHLAAALKEGLIPYAKTMSEYVKPEQAAERYEKLRAWREARGHFWVGHGPFYLHSVYPVQKIVVIRRSELFSDPAEKWLRFVEPRIAEVEVSGSRMLKAGSRAELKVEVSFQGKPYPAEDVESARFLLFNARGELVESGNAEPVRQGEWRIALSPGLTQRLPLGSNRLEVIVTSRAVALPSFRSFRFVTVPDAAG
jgi:peptide/nickel transport system substrate-binding protein